ncbi:MAG: DUF3343 domain-containing protein [Tissierellales bacterium]|nr:DUF3343 domain-containing protein [Tissierellales bacterium]
MEYIAIFYTHYGAVKYSKFLKNKNIDNQIMPVPRSLSSSCGICVKFITNIDINTIVSNDIESIFILKDGEFIKIYQDE